MMPIVKGEPPTTEVYDTWAVDRRLTHCYSDGASLACMRSVPLSAIRDAASGIYDVVHRTPMIPLPLPPRLHDQLEGREILLKLEMLQPTGSFKIRGAWNAVRLTPPEELADGIWTVSAGNAAQGVALAARRAGVPCSVLVMDTAPRTKVEAITRLGATIVMASHDECWRTVEMRRSDRMHGYFVHPFDDDRFIAGNGTIGLEILEDAPDVNTVVAALGGGGLLSGIGSALHALRPQAQVVAAEPETAAPFAASLTAGHATTFAEWTSSFVDGAGGRSVLPSMWPLLSSLISESLVMSLADIGAAMAHVAEHCNVITEGAAACAIAAALSGRAGRPGDTIVAVASGGNIDMARFAQIVGACPRG